MRLYHLSEDPGIDVFVPRPSPSTHHHIEEAVVWAVEETRLYNYLVPRNCPRISFFALESTRDADVARFLDGERTRRVLAVESAWLDRILTTELVQYEFATEGFTLFEAAATAGYYLSRRSERPISVQTITDPLRRLMADGVEVRFTPSLWRLRELVLKSSLGFSFIRMNRAAPPAEGYAAYHPI